MNPHFKHRRQVRDLADNQRFCSRSQELEVKLEDLLNLCGHGTLTSSPAPKIPARLMDGRWRTTDRRIDGTTGLSKDLGLGSSTFGSAPLHGPSSIAGSSLESESSGSQLRADNLRYSILKPGNHNDIHASILDPKRYHDRK